MVRMRRQVVDYLWSFLPSSPNQVVLLLIEVSFESVQVQDH